MKKFKQWLYLDLISTSLVLLQWYWAISVEVLFYLKGASIERSFEGLDEIEVEEIEE